MKVLIAGIGNIFCGDDGFGCEVIRRISREHLPEGAFARDFGIRSFDLACALTEDYEAIIMVDAMPRGAKPGTISVITPDLDQLAFEDAEIPDAHSMNPVAAITFARSIGRITAKLFLVGCEPALLEDASGDLDLSPAVLDAIPVAIATIQSLLTILQTEHHKQIAALAN